MRATAEPLAKRRRVESENGAKSFPHFPLLPTELRHLVYGKVSLFDRVTAAKSSPEAAEYFRRKRVKSSVRISLEQEQKNVFVKVQYVSAGYTEMHLIPDKLKARVRRDILSSEDCSCDFCDDRYSRLYEEDEDAEDEPHDIVVQFRYFDNGAKFANAVFGPLSSLVELRSYFHIKSAPVGGLVDLLQPTGKLYFRQPVPFTAWWHLLSNSNYKKNDPKIRIGNWEKWIDYTGTDDIAITNNLEDLNFGCLHQDFFDLPAFQKAAKVSLTACDVDISDKQLLSMKAHEIFLNGEDGSNRLTALGLLEFYKKKIKEWMLAPERSFEYDIKLEESIQSTALHMNTDRLLEDVREELKSPGFLIDPEFHLIWHKYKSHSELLFEHVESKRAIEITSEGFCTVDDPRGEYAESCRMAAIRREIDRQCGLIDEHGNYYNYRRR